MAGFPHPLVSDVDEIVKSSSEIVTLKIDITQPEHPWMQFAGMFKDDPQFTEMLDDIEAYRQEIDQKIDRGLYRSAGVVGDRHIPTEFTRGG
jgi:hypothetical protein